MMEPLNFGWGFHNTAGKVTALISIASTTRKPHWKGLEIVYTVRHGYDLWNVAMLKIYTRRCKDKRVEW